MISIVAVLVLSPRRKQQLINFSCRPEKLTTALVGLSKATGVPLSVDNTLKDDVVMLAIKNLPFLRVKNEIAKVEYGQWVPGTRGLILVSDSNALAKQEKSYRDYLSGQYLATLKKDSKSSSLQINVPNPLAIKSRFDLKPSPLFVKLIKSVGCKVIANIQRDTTITYSTQPNAKQISFPNSASLTIQKILRSELGANASEVFKTDFEIKRVKDNAGVLAEIDALRKDGTILYQETLVLSYVQGTAQPYQLNDINEPLRLTPFYKNYSNIFYDTNRDKLSPVQIQKLVNLNRYDPLILEAGDLDAYCKDEGCNLVASLPDELFWSYTQKPMTPDQYFSKLQRNNYLLIHKMGKLLTIAMADPVGSRSMRANRSLLTVAFRSLTPRQPFDLETLAMVAYACHGIESQLIGPIIDILRGNRVVPTANNSYHWLAFIYTLSPREINGLKHGQQLRLDLLNKQQRTSANKLVFNPNSKIELSSRVLQSPTHNLADYLTLPSEACPNGLSPNSIIDAGVAHSTCYQLIAKTSNPAKYSLKPEPQLGGQGFEIINNKSVKVKIHYPDVKQPDYLYANQFKRTKLKITIWLSPYSYISTTVRIDYVTTHPNKLSMEHLKKLGITIQPFDFSLPSITPENP